MVKPHNLRDDNTDSKKKIFNDPVYGFITYPNQFHYELIDHPWIQRLRRIRQLGFTDYVYSGASHSRFNHGIGALHLMTTAIQTLRWKGIEITDQEEEAAGIAILLHDVGHGPYSHALEKMIIPYDHERVSLEVMKALNQYYSGRLSMAIDIFTGDHPKKFLHQLVSGQLDMDRMDYLNRDSFYTGVVEGMIGYDRIIKMLNVFDDRLVVEEKGALSVEQFLMARRMMYWQVYLHKTVLAVEKMMQSLFRLVREKALYRDLPCMPTSLHFLMENYDNFNSPGNLQEEMLLRFLELDDSDLSVFLKILAEKGKGALKILAKGILERRIFKIHLADTPIPCDIMNEKRLIFEKQVHLDQEEMDYLFIQGMESNETYSQNQGEIDILMKDGSITPVTRLRGLLISQDPMVKHYLVYPRL